MIRTEEYYLYNLDWYEYKDVDKDNKIINFEDLIDRVIKSDQSFHISGRAGCGKSTLIKQFQERLTKENKKFITLCPTNKACLVMKDAMTFCKFSNKFKDKKNIEI